MDLLRHLRFFVAVADERHFGRAAASLGMTQPPVSHGIRKLEAHLGTPLFHRTTAGVELTEAGAALLPEARRVIASSDAFVTTARDSSPADRPVTIGIPPFAPSVAAAAVAAARDTLPGRRIEPREMAGRPLRDALREGELEVALVRHPTDLTGIHHSSPVRLPGRLVMPAGGGDPLDALRSPAAPPVALFPRADAPAAFDQIRDGLRRLGHSGEVLELGEVPLVVLVAAGACLGLEVDDDVPAILISVPLPGDPVPFRFAVARSFAGAALDDGADLLDAISRGVSGP